MLLHAFVHLFWAKEASRGPSFADVQIKEFLVQFSSSTMKPPLPYEATCALPLQLHLLQHRRHHRAHDRANAACPGRRDAGLVGRPSSATGLLVTSTHRSSPSIPSRHYHEHAVGQDSGRCLRSPAQPAGQRNRILSIVISPVSPPSSEGRVLRSCIVLRSNNADAAASVPDSVLS